MEVIIHGKEMVYGIVGACISESKKENETEQKNLKIEEYRIETGLSFAEIKNIISSKKGRLSLSQPKYRVG